MKGRLVFTVGIGAVPRQQVAWGDVTTMHAITVVQRGYVE